MIFFGAAGQPKSGSSIDERAIDVNHDARRLRLSVSRAKFFRKRLRGFGGNQRALRAIDFLIFSSRRRERRLTRCD